MSNLRTLVRYDNGYLYKPMSDRDIEFYFDALKVAGRKLAATSGCFDLLHTGHICLLQHCRSLADDVVVCLNGDESVALQKKLHSRAKSETERATILASIRFVDYVIIFDEVSPATLLGIIKPNFFVKGGDKTLDDIPMEERAAVIKPGGRVVFCPYEEGQSTSAIYHRIISGYIIREEVDGSII